VLTKPETIELREFTIPEIGDDDAILWVEACGICGADVEQFSGRGLETIMERYPDGYFPIIPGHEVVGRIDRIGRGAAERWGVDEGDRVAVEPMLPCRRCVECLAGTRHCLDRSIGGFPTYSQLPLSIEPSLWGGYSTHLYLHPFTVLHRVSESLSAPAAAMFNPIGNGFQWAVFTPDLKVGQSALVFGPGQRGLASVLALRTAGAGQVLVTGLSRDSAKLNLAREFGADHTIDVENEDVAEVVRGATDGRGVDVVIDTTPGAPDNLVEAIGHVRVGGTIVAPGLKHKPVEGLMTDQVIGKELTIKGVLSASSTAFEQAIRLIESDRFPLDKMLTHSFPLESAESAINTLAGRSENGDSICVSIVMT
jgi:threonine dehydrogenase-like Zn-dependent dehydrogenase